jgi:hypothetical protein
MNEDTEKGKDYIAVVLDEDKRKFNFYSSRNPIITQNN